MMRDYGPVSCRLYTREGNHHGRIHRVHRRLDLFGSQTADRIPTPVIHGRGDHGTLQRQRPSSRTTLRVGTRNGPEGTARVSSRDSLPGELRRTRPLAQRREGPATGCGYPCDRRASYLRRSATEVVATVYEPVGSGGARGLDRHGPSLRKVAQRTHPTGHPQPHELPAQADSERQTAEEDQETDAIFANVKEVQQQARSDPETLEISMDTKAKVALGDYARGGKNQDRRQRSSDQGMGSRSARQGETGPLRYPDGGGGSVDPVVRVAGDQRRLGRCLADVVAACSGILRTHQTPGDLSGQRSKKLGSADPVSQADGAVCRLVGVGVTLGVLSALPQQVQSDRTLLVGPGEEMERVQ